MTACSRHGSVLLGGGAADTCTHQAVHHGSDAARTVTADKEEEAALYGTKAMKHQPRAGVTTLICRVLLH